LHLVNFVALVKLNLLRKITFLLALGINFFAARNTAAQNTWIPPNLTIETASFQNWSVYTGVDLGTTQITRLTAPVVDVHEIITPSKTKVDRWSGLLVPFPDGGNCFRLGNRDPELGLDRLQYSFTVPAGENDFTLIYRYALSFAIDGQCYNKAIANRCIGDVQPYFKVELYNVTDDKYVDCAYKYIASPDSAMNTMPIPLLKKAYVKNWETVMSNLKNVAGKTFRLEFTTSHCSFGRHFMYAFIQLNQTSSKIRGNAVCTGMKELTLTAPSGFKKYKWFALGDNTSLGSKSFLKLNPAPPPHKMYGVEMESDEGCRDTFFTTIRTANSTLDLKVNGPILGCDKQGVNITAPSITTGSSPGLTFSYYPDTTGMVAVPFPKAVKVSGKYFIEAVNDSGCLKMESLDVVVYKRPLLETPDTIFGCSPHFLDLTNPYITNGSDTGLNFTYPLDMYSPAFLPDPKAIRESGLYFIRATNLGGCVATKAVYGFFAELKITGQVSCGPGDLTQPFVTAGSTPGYALSYWVDSSATTPLARPDSIIATGIYYIRGSQNSGCYQTLPVSVRVRLNAQFVVTNPPIVSYPAGIDLTKTVSSFFQIKYSYWRDSKAEQSIAFPGNIQKSGTYYIKGISTEGCSLIKPVVVNVIPPPTPEVVAPNAFSPNGDGINDEFTAVVKGVQQIESFIVFNRWGQVVYETKNPGIPWKGEVNGKPLPVGTYYWSLVGMDRYNSVRVTKTGSVTIIR
jgi:gliding motility-associated-like protein